MSEPGESLAWLGYPQVVLAVWGPLAIVAAWWLCRSLIARLPARERFMVGFTVAMTPLLALVVPYVPDSPLRDVLPWRPPLAWGMSVIDTGAELNLIQALVLGLTTVLPVLSLVVSFGVGVRQLLRTRRALQRLQPEREGGIWVTDPHATPAGFVACTAGLLRPRIIVGSDTAESVHADAVIAHEQAHAGARHPLLMFLATCVIRSWWWIPGRKAILRDLTVAAELRADERARRSVGAPAVAAALSAQLAKLQDRLSPAAFCASFAHSGTELAERAVALGAPARAVPIWQRSLVWVAAIVVSLLVIVLL